MIQNKPERRVQYRMRTLLQLGRSLPRESLQSPSPRRNPLRNPLIRWMIRLLPQSLLNPLGMVRRRLMRNSFLAVVLLAICPLLAAQQALNNDSVIKLIKAGLSDDLVITFINASPGTFDTTPNGLIALKKAKVSDKVVAAIVLKASGAGQPGGAGAGAGQSGFSPTATGPGGLPQGIDDVGVYFRDKTGAWVPMLPEIVIFESSGKFKNIASAGIVKGNLNGHIEGTRSKLSASFPVTLAVYLPETVEISEYQLLHLHPNADSRTFLSAAGGVLHTSAGAMKDAIDFQPEKMAPRLYQITLQPSAGKGEYGLLAPGTTNSSNKETSGKIYTVSIAE